MLWGRCDVRHGSGCEGLSREIVNYYEDNELAFACLQASFVEWLSVYSVVTYLTYNTQRTYFAVHGFRA